MANEASAADSMAQMQVAQQRLQALDRRLAELEASLGEIQTAIRTLENLDGNGAVPARIPVGAGVLVEAKIDAAADVLVEVGRGRSVAMSRADALNRLRERATATEAAFQAANDDADRTAATMQRLQAASLPTS